MKSRKGLMTKKRRGWARVPTKPSIVPESVRLDLSARAQALVESELKPRHVKRPSDNSDLNYIVDISTKWRGRFFYFVSKYACPGPNVLSPCFETGFARLEYQRDGRFSMAFMRHTGQWWPVYTHLTVDEVLNQIREDAFFQP